MSPQSENAHLSCSSEPREFSLEERKVLLNLAHEAIDSALEARAISLIPPSPHLAEPRGVFTTLYHRGGLRRSEEHTSELQSRLHLVCRLLLEKKNQFVLKLVFNQIHCND